MKKLVATLAFTLLAAGSVYAGMPAATGVVGSIHDMNEWSYATDDVYGRVCVFCHTPHNATGDEFGMEPTPLWNHQLPGTFDAYQWATTQNLELEISDPLVGPSRLCMSCHDGVTAVDQHGPASPFAGTDQAKLLGGRGDLTGGAQNGLFNDHPIGFSYGLALEKRNLESLNHPELVEKDQRFATEITPSTVQEVYNGVIRAGTREIGAVLYQGDILTCASCHEVHNKENVAQDVGTNGQTPNYLLYAKEASSLICLSCHMK